MTMEISNLLTVVLMMSMTISTVEYVRANEHIQDAYSHLMHPVNQKWTRQLSQEMEELQERRYRMGILCALFAIALALLLVSSHADTILMMMSHRIKLPAILVP